MKNTDKWWRVLEKQAYQEYIDKWFKSFDTEERFGYLLKEDVEELKKEVKDE